MHSILTFWHNLPWLIRFPFEFYFIVIVLRGIVAKDITSWMEDKGFIKVKNKSLIYRMLDFVYYNLKDILPGLVRHAAIVNHYREDHEELLGTCDVGQCAIFKTQGQVPQVGYHYLDTSQ